MTHFPHGAFIAIHAAEEQRKKLYQEEEEMTSYKSEDLEKDWEFKIVRSTSPVFRKPEVFQGLLAEESLAGWELVEKLDDTRIRFKRRRDARRRNSSLPPGMDPYRTQYGANSSQTTLVMMGIVMAVVLAVGSIVFFLTGDEFSEALPFFVTIPTILVTLAGFFVVARLRSRQ